MILDLKMSLDRALLNLKLCLKKESLIFNKFWLHYYYYKHWWTSLFLCRNAWLFFFVQMTPQNLELGSVRGWFAIFYKFGFKNSFPFASITKYVKSIWWYHAKLTFGCHFLTKSPRDMGVIVTPWAPLFYPQRSPLGVISGRKTNIVLNLNKFFNYRPIFLSLCYVVYG